MDETYGAYVDDECFDIRDYDDDTDHDADDDTDDDIDDYTNDDTDDDDDDDDGHGNLYAIQDQGTRVTIKAQGSGLKAQGPRSRIKDLV